MDRYERNPLTDANRPAKSCSTFFLETVQNTGLGLTPNQSRFSARFPNKRAFTFANGVSGEPRR
jgi:hypothetical protein